MQRTDPLAGRPGIAVERLAGAQQLDRHDPLEPVDRLERHQRRGHPHRDVVLLVVGGRDAVDADRVCERPQLGDQRRGRVLHDHVAARGAGIVGQERGQAAVEARRQQPERPPLGDRAEIGEREAERVERDRQRLAVEVAGRDHLGRVVEHQRVVGDRVEVGEHQLARRTAAPRARRRGPAPRSAASTRPGAAPSPGRAVRLEPCSAARDVGRDSLLCPASGRRRCTRGVERRQRARAGRRSSPPRRDRPRPAGRPTRTLSSAPIALMKCVPLISARPSLLSSSSGSRPSAARASAPLTSVAVGRERLALAQQRQERVRRGRQIAARAQRAGARARAARSRR